MPETLEQPEARGATQIAGFRPECPGCRYDLSATPDGRCPECGGAFTHGASGAVLPTAAGGAPSSLGATYATPLMVVGTIVLAYAAMLQALLHPSYTPGSDAELFGRFWTDAVSALVVLLFAPWALGSVNPRSVPLGVVSVHVVLLGGLGYSWTAVDESIGWFSATNLATVFGLLVLARACRLDRAGTVRFVWITGACALTGAGLLLIRESGLVPSGSVWSRVSDPRPGQTHRQYPLRVDEARMLGRALLTIGMPLTIVSAFAWRARR